MAKNYITGRSEYLPPMRQYVAQRIRVIRQHRQWSQETLAELAGLHRSYIGAVERGELNIGIDNIERIVLALEMTACELLNCQTS